MKHLILILLCFKASAFNLSELSIKNIKTSTSIGAGVVSFKEKDSNQLDLTFVGLGVGASYTHQKKRRFDLGLVLKKFVSIELIQEDDQSDEVDSSLYADVYLSMTQRIWGQLISFGYDNLNYFVGSTQRGLIEDIRLSRFTSSIKKRFNSFTPFIKLGAVAPIGSDASGVDASIGSSIQLHRVISLSIFAYYAALTVNDIDSTSSALGANLSYQF